MNRLELAVRSSFWLLFNKKFADAVRPYFEPEKGVKEIKHEAPVKEEKVEERGDAVRLLAILQRDGRLIDFLKEPLDQYGDAQIGAAVRDIHRDCAAALERIFAVRPLIDRKEDTPFTVERGFDPSRFRLTGTISGAPPYKGILRHHGWITTKSELPRFQAGIDAKDVIAPIEVEIAQS